MLAAGTKATIDQAVSRSFAGNLIVAEHAAPAKAAYRRRSRRRCARSDGVGSVTAIAFTKGRVRDLSQPGAPVIDEKSPVTAIEPQSFGAHVQGRMGTRLGGDARRRSARTASILSKKFASAHHLQVGQRLLVLTASGHQVTLTVRGIVKEEAVGLLSNLTISRALARTAFGQREDGVDFVAYAPGANGTQVQPTASTRCCTQASPRRTSQTAAQYTQEQSKKINKLLLLVYVLLALSVIVSLFGIVNTLSSRSTSARTSSG